jgi:hypothetical protein
MAALFPDSDANPLVGAAEDPPHSTQYALFVPAPSAPRLSCQEVQDFEVTKGWSSERWVPPTGYPYESMAHHQIGAFAGTGQTVSSSNLKFKRRILIIFTAGPEMLPFVPVTLQIPKENCLFPANVSPAMKQPSTCHFLLHNILNPDFVGCDPLLNASADEITRFFLTHLKRPIVWIKLEGKRQTGTIDGQPRYVTDFM